MADFEEKKYSIDPGPGKKMDGCPYSNFEDGHDVKDYIIPPKGYVFTGFKFDPLASNQVYDGKLIAMYTKEPLKIRLKSNLWKFLLVLIILAVVGLIILLASGVFNNPKTNGETRQKPKTEVEAKPSKKESKSSKTTKKLDDQLESTDNRVTTHKITKKDKKKAKSKEKAKNKEKEAAQSAQPAQPAQPVQPTQPVQSQNETNQPVQEAAQPIANTNDPNVLFKQEFWDLIHQRTIMMDPYHDLYVNYKDKASGEEYEYLRYTILKDFATFKGWYEKLKKVPASDLESLKTIDELTKKLDETK